MNDVHTRGVGWRQKLVHEMVEYYLNFVYLAFFLVAFTWYRRLTGGFEELASKGKYELLAQCLVMFGAFIPFFAFKELERVLGQDKLRGLFWSRATPASDSSCHGTAGENRS